MFELGQYYVVTLPFMSYDVVYCVAVEVLFMNYACFFSNKKFEENPIKGVVEFCC